MTRITNNAFSDHDPAWSPDGTRIAFERYVGEGTWEAEGSDRSNPQSLRWDIVVVAADGSSEVTLTRQNRRSLYWLPQWSPDGKWLAFIDNYVTDFETGESECRIVVILAEGGPPRVIPGSEDVGYFDWTE